MYIRRRRSRAAFLTTSWRKFQCSYASDAPNIRMKRSISERRLSVSLALFSSRSPLIACSCAFRSAASALLFSRATALSSSSETRCLAKTYHRGLAPAIRVMVSSPFQPIVCQQTAAHSSSRLILLLDVRRGMRNTTSTPHLWSGSISSAMPRPC
jgi:hypothetical protein